MTLEHRVDELEMLLLVCSVLICLIQDCCVICLIQDCCVLGLHTKWQTVFVN